MKYRSIIFVLAVTIGALCQLSLNDNVCLASGIDQKVSNIVKTAEIYAKQGQYDLAINLFGQAIKLQHSNLSLYYRRAFLWGKIGNYVNALKDLDFLIKKDELTTKVRFPSARKYKAECLSVLGYLDAAVREYQTFLRKSPKSGKIWYYLAEVYSIARKNDLALQAIQKGLETNSHWSQKLISLQNKILRGEKVTLHKPFSN